MTTQQARSSAQAGHTRLLEMTPGRRLPGVNAGILEGWFRRRTRRLQIVSAGVWQRRIGHFALRYSGDYEHR
jgi:hypothetical protein